MYFLIKYKYMEEKKDFIEKIESDYPEMTSEFKKIQQEQYEIFCRKQLNYGPGNIAVGSQLKTEKEIRTSLIGLWFRMNDKISRLKTMVVEGEPDHVGESVADSYCDLSVYGVIAQIVTRGKWGK
jgi:hypothetical protein